MVDMKERPEKMFKTTYSKRKAFRVGLPGCTLLKGRVREPHPSLFTGENRTCKVQA